jgi:hypothetical protein
MRTWIGIVALCAGCSGGDLGTAVGNPGHLAVVLTDVPYDVTLDQASFAVSAVELVGCDDSVRILRLNDVFDALSRDTVEFPGGDWCHTVVLPEGEGSLVVVGLHGEAPLEVALSPEPFALEGRYTVDGDTVLVSLSLAAALRTSADGWPSAPAGGTFDQQAWAPDEVGTALYIDLDQDGLTGVDERVAEPAEVPAGCRTAPAGGGLAALWGLLALVRSRRSRR